MAYDDVRTTNIALAGLIGAVLVFAAILLLEVVYYAMDARLHSRDSGEVPAEVANPIAQQRELLAGYGVVNQQKKVFRIPIARAMDLVVRDLSDQPSEPKASEGGRHEK